MIEKINIGCGPFYQEGWHNVDLQGAPFVADEYIAHPLDFQATWQGAKRIYAGHVIEHIPWETVTLWLDGLATYLADDGELCVVAPDMLKVFRLQDLNLYMDAMENDVFRGSNEGPGGRHQWNCYQDRLLRAFNGPLLDGGRWSVTPMSMPDLVAQGWPLVSTVGWQCGVVATPVWD